MEFDKDISKYKPTLANVWALYNAQHTRQRSHTDKRVCVVLQET